MPAVNLSGKLTNDYEDYPPLDWSSTKSDVPPQPGLTVVEPRDFKPGKTYLIEGPLSRHTRTLRLKGVFKSNLYPSTSNPHQCTLSSFTVVNRPIGHNNIRLPDTFYRYYETGAEQRALTRRALCKITGDPDFVYTPTPSKKLSASRVSSIHKVEPDHSSTIWSKHAALHAAAHKALENRINNTDAAAGRVVIPRAQSSYKVGVNSNQGGKTMRNRRRRRGCRSLKNKKRRNYSKRRY